MSNACIVSTCCMVVWNVCARSTSCSVATCSKSTEDCSYVRQATRAIVQNNNGDLVRRLDSEGRGARNTAYGRQYSSKLERDVRPTQRCRLHVTHCVKRSMTVLASKFRLPSTYDRARSLAATVSQVLDPSKIVSGIDLASAGVDLMAELF